MAPYILYGILKLIALPLSDAPKITLFTFDGNINQEIGGTDVGSIHGEVLSSTSGRWVVDDPTLALKVGDVIKYHVFVSVDSQGFLADNLSYIVTGKYLSKSSTYD